MRLCCIQCAQFVACCCKLQGAVAVQRAAKMIAKVDLGPDSYGNEKYVPSKRITRKGVVRNHRNLPIKTKNGFVQRSQKVLSTPSPDVVRPCGYLSHIEPHCRNENISVVRSFHIQTCRVARKLRLSLEMP